MFVGLTRWLRSKKPRTHAVGAGENPRHWREQLFGRPDVTGWSLDASAKAEIDRILREAIADPVGPEFMAPPSRSVAA